MKLFKRSKYTPLIERTQHTQRALKDSPHSTQSFRDWIKSFNRQLKPNRTVLLFSVVEHNRVSDFKYIYNLMLSELRLSQQYIVYAKRVGRSNLYNIKAKPTNEMYQQKIIRKSLKTWSRVFKHFHKKIMKNPRNTDIIIKRTCDRGLADWYQSVISSSTEFANYLVTISNVGAGQFHVVINCNINININKVGCN